MARPVISVPPGDVLALAIDDAEGFARRCPELYNAILDGAAFVNHARIEAEARAIVAVSAFRDA